MAESTTFIITPSRTLRKRQTAAYQLLRQNGELTDFTIVSQGKQFPCHRIVLAASSSFFEAMITTNMTEAKENHTKLETIRPEVR